MFSETNFYWLFNVSITPRPYPDVKNPTWHHIGQSTFTSFPSLMPVGGVSCQSNQAPPSSGRPSCCHRFSREAEERRRPSSVATVGQFDIWFTNILALFNNIDDRRSNCLSWMAHIVFRRIVSPTASCTPKKKFNPHSVIAYSQTPFSSQPRQMISV